MIVYLAGKITGDPGYREKFRAAREKLEAQGYTVLDPSVLPDGLTAVDYMRICTAMLDTAEAIAPLADWADSGGAQCEMHLARYAGKQVVETWKIPDLPGGGKPEAVEVVRCRSCRHYRREKGRDLCAKNANTMGGEEVGLRAVGRDDFFCADGERR